MRLCQFAGGDRGEACSACGYRLRRDYRTPPRRICTAEAKPGIGDRLATLLAAVGLTPQRYIQAKRLFGLAPKCGCSGRKQKLNAADARVREWLNRVGAWWRG